VSRYRVVLVTAPNDTEAERIAQKVVKKGLAACVNIVPKLLSIYRWEGSVERDTETLLIIKSTKKALPKLQKRIKKMHSYKVPEIVVLKVDGGDKGYLKWIDSVVK